MAVRCSPRGPTSPRAEVAGFIKVGVNDRPNISAATGGRGESIECGETRITPCPASRINGPFSSIIYHERGWLATRILINLPRK